MYQLTELKASRESAMASAKSSSSPARCWRLDRPPGVLFNEPLPRFGDIVAVSEVLLGLLVDDTNVDGTVTKISLESEGFALDV